MEKSSQEVVMFEGGAYEVVEVGDEPPPEDDDDLDDVQEVPDNTAHR